MDLVTEGTAIIGALVGVSGLVYGIWRDRVARAESRKRHDAEDRLRRYQTDPVIVAQSGGGSFRRGADGHPAEMSAGVSVTNRGADAAVALNISAGVEKDGHEAASPTRVPALTSSETRTFELDVPADLVALIGLDDPHGDLNLWVVYENRDGERFKVVADGPARSQRTVRLTPTVSQTSGGRPP